MMKTITAFAVAIIASAAVPAAEQYTPDIQPTIPMDIADPTLNMWKEKRADRTT